MIAILRLRMKLFTARPINLYIALIKPKKTLFFSNYLLTASLAEILRQMAKKTNKNIQKPAAPAPRPAQSKPAPRKQESPKKGFTITWKLAVLLGLLSFAVYANTLKNGYALDDFNTIKENTIVTQGISAIPQILATPYRKGWFVTTNDMYRPLSLTMFAAEYQLFDRSPVAGHFFNILFFAGCVMLLFFFLNSLFEEKKPAVAFIASLLFALHPIHTEVVANIKSRDEIMCFFFGFLSLNIFLKYIRSGQLKQLILGCLCFFLALISKETVITLLAIIPLIFYFYRNDNKKYSLNITIGAVAMAVLFLAIRYSVLSAYNANSTSDVSFIDNMLSNPPSAAAGFATKVLILGHYLKLLLVPYPLICDYCYNSIPFVTFSNIGALLSLAVYGFLAWLGISRLLKNKKDPFAFAIIFYLATISLFSNIPFIIGAPMAERFMFFTSVGFCLAVALAIEKLVLHSDSAELPSLKNPIVMGILVPVCLIYAVITFNRNMDWFDNYTLFKADAPKAPNDCRLSYYLGTELATTIAGEEKDPVKQKKIVKDGIALLYKSLAVYPDYNSAHASIGNAYFHIQQNDSAEVHEKRALELNPKDAITINNLAGVYFTSNKYPLAIKLCRDALELNPGYVNAYANIGLCYLHMGKLDSSLISLYKAVSVDPTFPTSYENLALTYKALGNADSVKKYEAKAKQKPF